MTRKFLIALTIFSLMLLIVTPPQSAQERQVGTRKPIERPGENRQMMDMVGAEKLRGELVTAFSESEALLKYLASYEFLRQNQVMAGYETVLEDLSKERVRIEHLSLPEIVTQSINWPDSETLNRVIELSRQVRNDEKFREVILRAERFSQTGAQSKPPSINSLNARGVIAAPAYIPPVCNHDDPSNYPSGTDLAIARGVASGLHTLADVLPALLGFLFSVPNFVQIAIVIAAGVADQVTNALEAVASDAEYCEKIRLYIEDKLANENGFTGILMADDYYLSFMLKSVRAAMTKATSQGIPTNCGQTRLSEGAAFFDGSDNFNGASGADRVTAYKKLRAAFQNIGAAACVQ